jgi:hypothetical protein
MAEEKKGDFWTKFEVLDRRVIYWILAGIICFTILIPVGLPLKVSSRTQDFYNKLKELPDGSTIMLSIDATIETWVENGPGAIAIAKYIASRRFKTVIWGFIPDTSLLTEKYMIPIFKEAGLKNGTDYAFIGFFPGVETTVSRLAQDIHGVIKKDFYGTPLKELPMMKDIKSAKDIALGVLIDGTDSTEYYVRHWNPEGVPIISTVVGILITGIMPFVESGQVSGILLGSRGNAEFEKLVGHLGKGVGMMDMLSITQTVLIIFLILGNYSFIRRRFRGKD